MEQFDKMDDKILQKVIKIQKLVKWESDGDLLRIFCLVIKLQNKAKQTKIKQNQTKQAIIQQSLTLALHAIFIFPPHYMGKKGAGEVVHFSQHYVSLNFTLRI